MPKKHGRKNEQKDREDYSSLGKESLWGGGRGRAELEHTVTEQRNRGKT